MLLDELTPREGVRSIMEGVGTAIDTALESEGGDDAVGLGGAEAIQMRVV
jgi:hypothetical protein